MTDETYEQEDWAGFTGAQTDIEDGSLHPATLVALERKRIKSQYSTAEDGKDPAIIWTFAMEDRDGETVDGTTSEATGEKSKARPWIVALIGKARTEELLRGRIGKEELIGRECLILIGINNAGYPKVTNVLPAQRATQTPAKAQVAQDTTPAPVAAPRPSDGPCEAFSDEFGRCTRDEGHSGIHRNKDGATWYDAG